MDYRAELEAKRARLAELRRQRERRQTRFQDNSQITKEPDLNTSDSASPAPSSPIVQENEKVALQQHVQSESPESGAPLTVDVECGGSSVEYTTCSAQLYSISAPIVYVKSVITTPLVTETPALSVQTTISSPRTPEIKSSTPEYAVTSPRETAELVSFADSAWRVVARLLDPDLSGPVLREYAQHPPVVKAPSPLKQMLRFEVPKMTVSSISWSPLHDILAVAYRVPKTGLPVGCGMIYIWSLSAPSQPEWSLRASTDITNVRFGQEPNCIYAGGYNGSVMKWDLHAGRVSLRPKAISGHGGHTVGDNDKVHLFPICGLDVLSASIISCSTDGVLCGWASDSLVEPRDRIKLKAPSENMRNSQVLATVALSRGPDTIAVGALNGCVYEAHWLDRVSARGGADRLIARQNAPVTALSWRSRKGLAEDGAYLLTAGLDWAIRIWFVSDNKGIIDEEHMEPEPLCEIQVHDACGDAAWCPDHPCLFAAVIGKELQLWNLLRDIDEPLALYQLAAVGSSIAWKNNMLAVGSVEGTVAIFEVAKDVVASSDSDWTTMRNRRIAGSLVV